MKKVSFLRCIFRRLDCKLMTLVCAAVIPINLMAIAFSHFTVEEARERVLASYEKEFEIFMEQEKNQLDTLDEWFRSLSAEHRSRLMNPDLFSEVESICLVNEAGRMLNLYGIHGFFYLEEKRGNQKVFLKGSSCHYTEEEKCELKASVRGLMDYRQGWKLEAFGSSCFFYKGYSYANCNLVFALDIQNNLQNWSQPEMQRACRVSLSDNESTLLMKEDGSITLAAGTKAKQCQAENMKNYKIQKEILLDSTGSSAALMSLSDWRIVPVSYQVLRGAAWLSLVVLFLLWLVIRREVLHPLRALSKGMGQLDLENWEYRMEENSRTEDFAYLYEEFNRMAEDLSSSRQRDILLYETQMNNLKLQVNPHMLLNSLTMIYSLAETKQYMTIQKFTMNLVDYFRYCLRETNTLVTVKAEMKFVESYMEIQKIRYPGELSIAWKIEPEAENMQIPPLIIQNFVENAAKYARIPDQTVEILLNIRIEDEHLCISISDTGKGIAPDILSCLNSGEMYVDHNSIRHIGIWNCRQRLEAFYGKRASLRLTSEKGSGTQVWMEIPISKQDI